MNPIKALIFFDIHTLEKEGSLISNLAEAVNSFKHNQQEEFDFSLVLLRGIHDHEQRPLEEEFISSVQIKMIFSEINRVFFEKGQRVATINYLLANTHFDKSIMLFLKEGYQLNPDLFEKVIGSLKDTSAVFGIENSIDRKGFFGKIISNIENLDSPQIFRECRDDFGLAITSNTFDSVPVNLQQFTLIGCKKETYLSVGFLETYFEEDFYSEEFFLRKLLNKSEFITIFPYLIKLPPKEASFLDFIQHAIIKGKRNSLFSREDYSYSHLISLFQSIANYKALHSTFLGVVFIYYICREWGYLVLSFLSREKIIRVGAELRLKPNLLYIAEVSCLYTSKFKKDKVIRFFNPELIGNGFPFVDMKKEVVEYLLSPQIRKKISIVVPFFNRELYITKQFIESYCKLVEPYSTGLELVFVDDGSTDNTLSMLRSISSSFPCEVTVVQHANKGPSGARNSGFKVAKGEYVLFADSDVFIYPGTLERLLFPFFMNKEVVVSGGIQLSKNPITLFDRWRNDNVFRSAVSLRFHISNSIGMSNYPHDTAILLVKKMSEDQKMFDETYKLPGYEDIEYVYRIKREGGQCASVPVVADNQRSLKTGSDFMAQALARKPGFNIFLNQYKEDNLDLFRLAHIPNVFSLLAQVLRSISTRSYIPLVHYFYAFYLRLEKPQELREQATQIFLGKGTTFSVYKINPTRVIKVKHGAFTKIKLLFSGLIFLMRKKRFKFLLFFFLPYNIFGKEIVGEDEAINFICANSVLNKQFGHPTVIPKGIEQDYVTPIFTKLPELNDFEYYRILMEYVEGVYRLWSFGYFEMVFFFQHNIGLNQNNEIVFLDINEITSDREVALHFLKHKMFNELILSINNSTKKDMTYIVFNKYFTLEAFNKHWKSDKSLKSNN